MNNKFDSKRPPRHDSFKRWLGAKRNKRYEHTAAISVSVFELTEDSRLSGRCYLGEQIGGIGRIRIPCLKPLMGIRSSQIDRENIRAP